MKPAPIYLLIDGKADGPHEAAEIVRLLKAEPQGVDKSAQPLTENTLSCIDGMKRWQMLSETLIYSYAKLLPVLPLADLWIRRLAHSALELPAVKIEIRETLRRAIGLDDRNASDYLLPAMETNSRLLRLLDDYKHGGHSWAPDAIKHYPLMEFVPVDKTSLPRWICAWLEAGGVSHQDRIISRKDDPCWTKFSDFGFPFAPFSFGRDGLLHDVSIARANEVGFMFDPSPIKLPVLPPFKIVGI
jgi:hypothetical protein